MRIRNHGNCATTLLHIMNIYTNSPVTQGVLTRLAAENFDIGIEEVEIGFWDGKYWADITRFNHMTQEWGSEETYVVTLNENEEIEFIEAE